MSSIPARYRYSRNPAGFYLVLRNEELIGRVERDGSRWLATTPDGQLLGDTYGTRVEATDALSATARRRAELDALPTDEPAAEQVVHPGDDRPSCPSCRYYSGHTSWCPRRHAEQPAGQLTVDAPADEDVADRTTPVAELDDRGLWLQFMLEDRALSGYDDDPNTPDDERHGALITEISRRFGADATENTADHAVSLHMSGDDLVAWARDRHEHLIGIATGRIVPEWRRGSEYGAELEHGGCADCEQHADSAETIARATGSVSGSYSDGTHGARVTRARQFVGR